MYLLCTILGSWFEHSLSETPHTAPVIPVQHTMQEALFVKTLTTLSSPTPASTPTLSLSGSLLHIVGVLTHDIYSGLNTTRQDWGAHAAYTTLFLPSLWVKPSPLLGKRCDKKKNRGGREVENEAEPKLSCHSLTGVLTIIGCHHFLIRPVSRKCSNKTAVQGEVPSLLYKHTDIQSCVTDVHTHHTETCKHIKCVKKCCVQTMNKTGLVAQWNGSAFCCRDIPNKPKQGCSGFSSWQLIE